MPHARQGIEAALSDEPLRNMRLRKIGIQLQCAGRQCVTSIVGG